MITQHEFCYCRETVSPTRAASLMKHIPFSLSCKTFCSVWKEHLNAPQDCPASLRVARRIQLFCARFTFRWGYQPRPYLKRTRTILVSSNSCWTLIIVSACLGSWYFWIYVFISGKDIDDGLLNDDWGTLVVNSSRIFVSREKAGRTGYSSSVIITACKWFQSTLWDTETRNGSTSKLFFTSTIINVCNMTLFLHCLPLPLRCSFCNSLRKERHEFPSGSPLIETEGG